MFNFAKRYVSKTHHITKQIKEYDVVLLWQMYNVGPVVMQKPLEACQIPTG